MTLAQGDAFVVGDVFSFQQANRIYDHFRAASVPSNLQAGGLWSDSVNDKLFHKGASLFEVYSGATEMYKWKKGGDKASAAALDISDLDGNYFDVTGVDAITSISASGRTGTIICLHFDGILDFTHHATNLILPTGATIATAAGDEAILIEYDTGKWRCINYSRADGTALVGAGADKIEEGDSSVEVVDAGTGYIETKADNIQIRKDAVLGNIQPVQPCCLVTKVADMVNFAVGEAVRVTFDTERFDQGSNFNVGTYTFTGSVTARYLMAFCIKLKQVDIDATSYTMYLTTSNLLYTINLLAPLFSGDAAAWVVSAALIVDMDVNDTVTLEIWQTGGAQQTDLDGNDSFWSIGLFA